MRNGFSHPDAQIAIDAFGGNDGFFHTIREAFELLCILQQHFAPFRELQACPGSLEQCNAKRVFQLFDPGGYGWLIPAGKDAVLGTGMEEQVAHEALDDLHRQLAGAGLVGDTILSQSAGAVPVGGLREKLAWGNILFAGDAAGLAHPLTGAGIHPAVVSGEAAGKAAAEWASGHLGAIPSYEAKMRGQFSAVLARALRNREPLEMPFSAAYGEPDMEAGGWHVVRGAFEQEFRQ